MKLDKIVIAALALSATAAIAGGTHKHSTAQTASSEPNATMASGSAATNATLDSDTIRQVQTALNSKGFDAGSPDGQVSAKTKSALKKFQQAQGINQSGSIDGQTLAALGVQGSASAQASGFGPATQPSGSAASPIDTATSSPGTNAAQNPGKAGNPAARSGQ